MFRVVSCRVCFFSTFLSPPTPLFSSSPREMWCLRLVTWLSNPFGLFLLFCCCCLPIPVVLRELPWAPLLSPPPDGRGRRESRLPVSYIPTIC
jgi:hypothetical protein